MAILSITAANIVPDTASTGYATANGVAAVTITQGQVVYKLANNTIGLADADAVGPAYTVRGIAVNSVLAGQVVTYQTGGLLNFGAILVAGKFYVVGTTPGSIAPVADLAAGWYSSLVGVATSTSVMMITLKNSGTVVA